MRVFAIATLAATALGAAPACIDRTVAEVVPQPSVQEQTEFPVHVNRDLDILFVIDNSGSMLAEQTSLADNFNLMIEQLQLFKDGLPNIHLGVVSTNMGGGPSKCSGNGDEGVLQNTPREPGCSPPRDRYISNIDGVGNYDGTMADAFSCIARLGDLGCGFEQPLQAMRAALDPTNAANAGFLRPEARLAVIFITDEDDCSTFDTAMFARNAALGPQKSFRCFAHGVTCDDDLEPGTMGPRRECEPRKGSSYMTEVQEYISFLKGLKPYENLLMVAGIVGAKGPIEIVKDPQGDACLMYSCGEATVCGKPGELSAAVPPVRLNAFFDAFSNRLTASICDADLSSAVDAIGEFIKDGLGGTCLGGQIADIDPETEGLQADCSVTEVRGSGTSAQAERILPSCDNRVDGQQSGNLPCFLLTEDAEKCSSSEQRLSVELFYDLNETVPPDTIIRAYCLGE